MADPTWHNHTVIRKFGLLVVLFAAPVGASDSAAPLDNADGAALAALRGDPQRARAMLAMGSREQVDPAALVVLTSIALDEGKLKEAARLVGRLRSVRPAAAETLLLGALVKERAEHARSDWTTAGLAALKSVHPLPESTPLLDPWERIAQATLNGADLFPFPEESVRKLAPADAFLVRWTWPRSRSAGPDVALVEEAIHVARGDERLLVHLVALDVLDAPSGPHGEEGAAARRELVERVQRKHPGSARLMVLAKHSDTEAVTEDDVASLETAVADEGEASLARHYLDLLRLMDKIDPATAPVSAMNATMRLAMSRLYPAGLGSRMAKKPELPPEVLERLARALIRLAHLQEREGFLLTDMFSRVSLGMASSLRDDAALKDRADSIRAEVEGLLDVHRCLAPLQRLPIRSLQREWAEQIPVERPLLQHAAHMGLSCPAPQLKQADAPHRPDPR